MSIRLIFACWPAVEYQGRVLTQEGATRLVSFWFSRDMPDADFVTYCRTGMVEEGSKRKRKGSSDPALETIVMASDAGRAPTPPWEDEKDEDDIEIVPVRRGRK